jgi:hypothetical protein
MGPRHDLAHRAFQVVQRRGFLRRFGREGTPSHCSAAIALLRP